MKWYNLIGEGSKLPPVAKVHDDCCESDKVLIEHEGCYYICFVSYGEEGIRVSGGNWCGDNFDTHTDKDVLLQDVQWTEIEAPS